MNGLVNKESYIPYYLQIYNELKNRIELMVYKPNEILPSENELVREFNVTRVTVRNAIKKLKDEGRIYTEKGRGSYVNSPKIVQNLDKIYSFGRGFEEKGYKFESDVIEAYTETCNSVLQKKLQLLPNESVIVIKMLRKLEGIPVVLQTSYIPKSLAPEIATLDLNRNSIYDVLENEYNIKLLRATEYLDPIVSDEYYSKLLHIEVNTPLFLTERITYSENGKPVEFRRCAIRNDKFRFSVELN